MPPLHHKGIAGAGARPNLMIPGTGRRRKGRPRRSDREQPMPQLVQLGWLAMMVP